MVELVQFSVQGIAAGSLYAIVALGLVLLYRGTRVLSFAHTEFGALGAYVFWLLYPSHAWLPVALLVGVATAGSAGVLSERLVARPLAGASRLTLAVSTLALAELVRAVVVLGFGPEARSVPPLVLEPALIVGRIILPAQRVLILATSAVLALGLLVFLRRTMFGLAVRAASEDRVAVRLRGIGPAALDRFSWGVSAALSGVAAILVSPLLGLHPYFMTGILIRAFAAALLGGMTSLGGAVVGGLAVGLIEAHLQRLTGYPGAIDAALFATIVAILIVRPHGLFGTHEASAGPSFEREGRRARVRLPLPRMTPHQRVATGCALATAATAAAVAAGAHATFAAVVTVCFASVGVSLHILSGLAGQLSLGHAAFLGTGGFMMGILTSRLGIPYPVSVLVAGVAAGFVAVAVGLPALRIRGLYLAVTTLAFGIAAERYLFRLNAVSGGSAGVDLPDMSTERALAVALVVLAASVVLAWRVGRSKAGRALAVIHADETLAETWGINPGRYKLLAFGLSGLLAGWAGAVYATLIGHITSEAFTLQLSITLVAMAIVGGLGSVSGVVAGAVLFGLLPEILPASGVGLAHGAILVAVIIFLPRGLGQLWEPAT